MNLLATRSIGCVRIFQMKQFVNFLLGATMGRGSASPLKKSARWIHKFFKDFIKLMDENILKEDEKEKNFIDIMKEHEEPFLKLVDFFYFCNKHN